ncbi:MAG TPA: hypothetical protein PKY73_12420, partial [Hyphomonas sp.]|nr:hypothetical protein [Hyphomonas sp.]
GGVIEHGGTTRKSVLNETISPLYPPVWRSVNLARHAACIALTSLQEFGRKVPAACSFALSSWPSAY